MKSQIKSLFPARRLFLRMCLGTTMAISLATGAGTANAGMELQAVENGEAADLDNLIGNGQWTLVMVWAINCHVCHLQKPEISAFHDKHKDTDAHVVGISLDGVEQTGLVKAYIEENNVSFPSYVGNIAIIASHYMGMTEESLRGTPTYLLFSPEGELLGNNPGRLSVDAIESFMARHNEAKTTG